MPLDKQFRNWRDLNVTPYDKEAVHPFGRCRGIVANGIDVEAVMFSHGLARNTLDLEVTRQLALVRRIEAQQHKSSNRPNS